MERFLRHPIVVLVISVALALFGTFVLIRHEMRASAWTPTRATASINDQYKRSMSTKGRSSSHTSYRLDLHYSAQGGDVIGSANPWARLPLLRPATNEAVLIYVDPTDPEHFEPGWSSSLYVPGGAALIGFGFLGVTGLRRWRRRTPQREVATTGRITDVPAGALASDMPQAPEAPPAPVPAHPVIPLPIPDVLAAPPASPQPTMAPPAPLPPPPAPMSDAA